MFRSIGFGSAIALLFIFSAPAKGALLFESATTAKTGPLTFPAGGIRTDFDVFSGVNFFVDSTVHVDRIGGNFHQSQVSGNNQIFGAIVPVDGMLDPPDPADLSSNVLGTTTINLPLNSFVTEIVSGPLSLTLSPGWYGIIFGSGKFGATGEGIATTQDADGPVNTNGILTYALLQPSGQQSIQAPGPRYFVKVVPEPSSNLGFITLGILGAILSFKNKLKFSKSLEKEG